VSVINNALSASCCNIFALLFWKTLPCPAVPDTTILPSIGVANALPGVAPEVDVADVVSSLEENTPPEVAPEETVGIELAESVIAFP